MTAKVIKYIFYIYSSLFLSHFLFGASIVTGVAAASYVRDSEAVTSNYPLEVTNHPSTYFDIIKPIYNDFTHYGIYIKLPIGDVLRHAKAAIRFIHSLPYDQSANRKLATANSSSPAGGNNIKTAELDPTLVWSASMNQMLRLKVEALAGKITEMERSIEAHANPASSLYEAMALHQRSQTRFGRSVNIDFDVSGAIHSFFDGVSSIFHFVSMRQLQQSVTNLQITQTRMEDFTVNFATKMVSLLETLEMKRREDTNTLSSILTSFMILDEAESAMDVVNEAITPLLQGIIPTYVVTPAALVEMFDEVKEGAAQNGLELAIQSPNEILKLKPMTFQRNEAYELVISLPVVDPKTAFQSYHLVNLPALRKQSATVWDLPDIVYGLRPTLYPKTAEHVAIEVKDIPTVCDEYYVVYLCHVPTITQPDCVADLFHNLSTNCLTRTMTYVPTLVRATQSVLFFFKENTNALLQCGDDVARVSLKGLVRIEDRANCLLTTDHFTYTFVGNTPSRMFQTDAPKVVDFDLMPDPPEVSVRSDIEDQVSIIERMIGNFNNSTEERQPIQQSPPINYISLAIGLLTLTSLVLMTVLAICKAQGHLCCPHGNLP